MNSISEVYIRGYKKFNSLSMLFNQDMNIIIGENESGKSSILEAISIVLNQKYKDADKSILVDLFNIGQKTNYKNSPSITTLPSIEIEVFLNLDKSKAGIETFWGQNNYKKTSAFGIRFECKVVDDYNIDDILEQGKIPYEFYELSWTTFAGSKYNLVRKPLKSVLIDTSSQNKLDSFNYYNKSVFNSAYEDLVKLSAKDAFREKTHMSFKELELTPLGEDKYFCVNDKKMVLENIISIYDKDIQLENKGSGMENLIKTQIALDKTRTKLDVIFLEEPENHLSFLNVQKMINEIERSEETSQIILTTHSSMIVSRLNLKNVLWIETESSICSFKEIECDVANFFTKAANNNLLEFLLSKKIVLVEGPTEHILFPFFYEKIVKRSVVDDGIFVLSCGGITYKNFTKIAEKTNKKVAVLTDNDKNNDRIFEMNKLKTANGSIQLFMGNTTTDWTWEVALYNCNKAYFDKAITLQKGAKYLFNGNDVGSKYLGKMLNNKVETAYNILLDDPDLITPQYVKDAIEWIRK